MASFSVQMSGARDYVLTLYVDLASQNFTTNISVVSWSLVASGSWGSFGSYATSYSVSINGNVYAGSIPSFNPNPNQVIRSGTTSIGHDSNGYASFPASGFWNSAHTNIGQGTASGTVTLSRIPKVPAAPTPLSVDEATPTGFKYRFSGGSNNGSAILRWESQVATDAAFTQNVKSMSDPSSGTHIYTGLLPGQVYYARSRGVNSIGNGAWSSSLSIRTLSGAYVRRGNTWKPVEVLVYRSGQWKPAEIFIYKDGAWKAAS